MGRGYCNKGLFVLNIFEVMNNNASSSFAYMLDSINLWHGRLGHVNSSYIKKMQTLGLTFGISDSFMNKCGICVRDKLTRKSYIFVERESELLIKFDTY